MKNNNKVLSLLGLATKAGKIASGEFSTEKSVKSGKGFLVLVAADASENTKKKFRNMCEFYEVPVYFLADKEELGKFCGKEFRASLAVQDENFAKAMLKELEKMEMMKPQAIALLIAAIYLHDIGHTGLRLVLEVFVAD